MVRRFYFLGETHAEQSYWLPWLDRKIKPALDRFRTKIGKKMLTEKLAHDRPFLKQIDKELEKTRK